MANEFEIICKYGGDNHLVPTYQKGLAKHKVDICKIRSTYHRAFFPYIRVPVRCAIHGVHRDRFPVFHANLDAFYY